MRWLTQGKSSPFKATARANSAAPSQFYQPHSPASPDLMTRLTMSSDMRYSTTQRAFGLSQQLRLSPTEQPHQDHQMQRFTQWRDIRYKSLHSVHSGAKVKQSASAGYLTRKDLFEKWMEKPAAAQLIAAGTPTERFAQQLHVKGWHCRILGHEESLPGCSHAMGSPTQSLRPFHRSSMT